jgi:hypothetical protein
MIDWLPPKKTPTMDTSDERVLGTFGQVSFAKIQQSNTEDEQSVVIVGVGTLVVTSKRVRWCSEGGNEQLEFLSSALIMHALSREGNSPDFEQPCIYCQVDELLGLELYFAPANIDLLDVIFRTFSETSMLNPPPEEEEEMGEDFEGFYGEVDSTIMMGFQDQSREEGEASSDAREAMLAHLDSILQVPPHLDITNSEQFEDPPNADGP